MQLTLARRACAGALFVSLVLAGCASSPPRAKFADASKTSTVLLQANDTVAVAVSTGTGVTMADYEKTRLRDQIQSKLAAKQAQNAAAPSPFPRVLA